MKLYKLNPRPFERLINEITLNEARGYIKKMTVGEEKNSIVGTCSRSSPYEKPKVNLNLQNNLNKSHY